MHSGVRVYVYIYDAFLFSFCLPRTRGVAFKNFLKITLFKVIQRVVLCPKVEEQSVCYAMTQLFSATKGEKWLKQVLFSLDYI